MSQRAGGPGASDSGVVGTLRLRTLLGLALTAGAAAGLLAGLFHYLASEPVIELAIALEGAGHADEAVEVVSREGQKVGLFIAMMLYGLIWGLLVAAFAHLLRIVRPAHAALLVLVAGWSGAIYPFLKYPPNPPGVGDPDTLLVRQITFFVCLAVGAGGALGGVILSRRWGLPTAVLTYATLLIVAYVALPTSPDPITVEPSLLLSFRSLALGGQVVFWAVFAAAFGMLVRRSAAGAVVKQPVTTIAAPR